MRTREALFALALGAVASATPLRAQDQIPERSGLNVSVGGSLASAGVSCDPKCSSDRRSGPVWIVRGGAYVAPQLNLLLEGDFFHQNVETSNGSQGRWALSWYMIGLQWYPNVDEDVFIHLGVGLGVAHTHVTFPTVGTLDLTASDLGGTIGAGRDFHLTNNSALTLFANYNFISKTNAALGRSDSGAKLSADIVHAGLLITFF